MPPPNAANVSAVDWDATLPGIPIRTRDVIAALSRFAQCDDRRSWRVPIDRREMGNVRCRHDRKSKRVSPPGFMPQPNARDISVVDQDATLPGILIRTASRFAHRQCGIPGRVASQSTAVKRAPFDVGMTVNRNAFLRRGSCHNRTRETRWRSIGMRSYRACSGTTVMDARNHTPPPHPLNRNPTPGSVNTYRESNAESPSLCRNFPTRIRR